MKKKPIRVLIVDDHVMVRSGLRLILMAFEDLKLVGEAANGEEAIRLCEQEHPDVVLMDMVMPVMDGTRATAVIKAQFPHVRVIGLTTFYEPELIQKMIDAGAHSFLLKNISATELAKSLRDVYAGKIVISQEINMLLKGRRPYPAPFSRYNLSPRESEVLAGMLNGLSNAEIAGQLVISLSTTKFHVSSILAKLNVTSRAEVIALAMNEGVVIPSHAKKDA